CQQYNSAPWTC
nr:immunoglobulin light chain junction region [Macaca mulatta]MOW54425.1 immunoglobulin light chain junction region [Macaca mulatta]MOW56132.1 immunoglobulin light chain junction region [Macaca mulatta]